MLALEETCYSSPCQHYKLSLLNRDYFYPLPLKRGGDA